ncbi:phosphatidylinositol-glycan biosynthesis class W protein [Rhinophrynus dorsalis]
MSEKLLKEAFVSNLNGTSIGEVTLGLSVPPLCFLCRGLVLVLHQQKYRKRAYSWKVHLLFDFLLLVVLQVLSCTILSEYLVCVILAVAALCVTIFFTIYRGRTNCTKIPLQSIFRSLLKGRIENETVPAVTALRVYLNVLTAVSILAVDFPVFPRRYAKTETYGTGVMDLGVGCFIFANAIVSPEARAHGGELRNRFSTLAKQLMSVWPLLVLGFGRLISVKAAEYHEHESEYGVHWNFFFTLAIVRVLSSLLLAFVPVHQIWVVGVAFASCYQFVLETTNLKSFVFYGTDGKGTRVGFLNANREGIFSIIGYVAVYMAGVQVGLYVLKKRSIFKDWISPIRNLTFIAFILFGICHLFQECIEPVSRRLANLAFCVWIVAQCLLFLCCILLCDLILLLAKHLVTGSKVPCTWNICISSYSNRKHGPTSKGGQKEIRLCLIEAISRNQLLFFLVSNIMTGIVNMLIDTIHSNNLFSISVLLVYMFLNCFIVYFLHIQNITLKWW